MAKNKKEGHHAKKGNLETCIPLEDMKRKTDCTADDSQLLQVRLHIVPKSSVLLKRAVRTRFFIQFLL